MEMINGLLTLKTLAGIELFAAFSFIAFWVYWLNFAREEDWMPEGFMDHERLFVFPDLTIAAIFGLSAFLLLNDNTAGLHTSLLGAGMMMFLIIIDIVYLGKNGLFALKRNGGEHITIILLLIIICFFVIFTVFSQLLKA